MIIKNLPQTLAAYISLKGDQPVTFQGLLQIVHEYEQHGSAHRATSGVPEKTEVSVAATSEIVSTDKTIAEMQSVMQTLIRELADIKAATSSEAVSEDVEAKTPPTDKPDRGRRPKRDITCYYCGLPNHYQRDCRHKKRDDRNRRYDETQSDHYGVNSDNWYNSGPYSHPPIQQSTGQQWHAYHQPSFPIAPPLLTRPVNWSPVTQYRQETSPIISYPPSDSGN